MFQCSFRMEYRGFGEFFICRVKWVFVFLRRDDNRQSKVLRIVDGHVQGEYQYDENGKELFNSNCYVFFLAENQNGDICVSDTASLVVLDRRGKFRYLNTTVRYLILSTSPSYREAFLPTLREISFWRIWTIDVYICWIRMGDSFAILHAEGR